MLCKYKIIIIMVNLYTSVYWTTVKLVALNSIHEAVIMMKTSCIIVWYLPELFIWWAILYPTLVCDLAIFLCVQFVEIKSSLFKHVDHNSLLYISCSDVKERFHYSILLLVVFVRNMTEFHWNPGMFSNLCCWIPDTQC